MKQILFKVSNELEDRNEKVEELFESDSRMGQVIISNDVGVTIGYMSEQNDAKNVEDAVCTVSDVVEKTRV